MIKILKNTFDNFEELNFGNKLFLIGVFFLPSALPISGLFLLISLIISFKKNQLIFLKDKWNLPLLASIGIILFSTLNISFINKPSILSGYSIGEIWINLINWIPIFICYWGFQFYLKTNKQRIYFTNFLVSGLFPVVISIILQKYFSFYGPYKTFYGLIVWFQKPIIDSNGPASGLFSNPNYAATWLVLVLPFALFLLNLNRNYSLKKYFLTLFNLFIFYLIFLTASRNGILGIIISIICIYGLKNFLISFSLLISLLPLKKFIELSTSQELFFINEIVPSSLISKLSDPSFYSNLPRLDIWESAITRIQERPFLGWGASTFPFLHLKNNSAFNFPNIIVDAQHSHNLALELAHNFGIPLSIIIISTVMLIILRAWKCIFFHNIKDEENIINKAFFASSFIFFVSHINDITLYDGKINIFISILFAGLKTILDEKENKKSLIY